MAAKQSLFDLGALFGSKSWYQSLTAWGLVLYALGEQFIAAATEQGILGAALSGTLSSWVGTVGVVLTALGIRRRL